MLVAPSASMDALLKSCEDVLRRYVADEVAMAGEEMPADRTAEAVYVQHPPPAFFFGFSEWCCSKVHHFPRRVFESDSLRFFFLGRF